MHISLRLAAIAALVAAPALAQSNTSLDPHSGAIFQDADDAAEETPKWTGSVNAAASFADGNTNRRTAGVGANAERRGDNDRLTLGFQWNYADEQTGGSGTRTISQRRTRGNAKYDYFVSETAYLYTNASAENDRFSDLDLRLVVGAGGGKQFYEEEDFKFSAEAGLAYYDEQRKVGMDSDYVAARIAYHLESIPRENITFIQDVEALPSVEDSDDIYLRKDSRLRLTITDKMFTQFQWILDYDNTPAAGLERVDHLFLIGVGWEF